MMSPGPNVDVAEIRRADAAAVDDRAVACLAVDSEAHARAVTSEIVNSHIVSGMAEWLGPPRAYARALSAVLLLHGFMLFMQQLQVDDIPEATVEWLERCLQSIADESDPVAGEG